LNGANITGGANEVQVLVQDQSTVTATLVDTLRGTPAAGTLANATAATRLTDMGTVQVGDWVRFTLAGAAGSPATNFEVQITDGMTFSDFVQAVNAASAFVDASFDDATRLITFDRPGTTAGDTVAVTIVVAP
jgi:multidrug efflux pump subunit AcrB